MKQKDFIIALCLLFLTLNHGPAHAETVTESDTAKIEAVKHAVRVLKNIDKDISKQHAMDILTTVAEKDSVAYAMNAIGLAYMGGTGVEKDSLQAVAWMEKAARSGFTYAYHNLGMMYKYAKCGVKQDFSKAYGYYCAGADSGSVMCQYDKGFMLYKGLGCKQSYEDAIKEFEKAGNREHSPSLYMLGLCYRNGYGTEQDTARAMMYLNRAAALGFNDAIEEIYRANPENYLNEEWAATNMNEDFPDHMPDVTPTWNDINLMEGKYNGYVVMYDWSGQYVLGEKPVCMEMHQSGEGQAAGVLVLGTDSVDFQASMTKDGRLVFSKGSLKLNERYTVGKKAHYKIGAACLDIFANRMSGSLSLYSKTLKEPERPMYLELTRGELSEAQTEDERYTYIYTSPNPFSSSFDAEFDLSEECDAQVRIFDKMGTLIYSQFLGHLDKGKNKARVTPSIRDGIYVMNIKAGLQVLRAIIVKKRE